MWRGMMTLAMCGICAVAWADWVKLPTKDVDLGEFTSELKQAVPNLEGCDETNKTITCRRLSGDFTSAERDAMDAALLAHDSTVKAKRAQARQTARIAAEAKLKALGLTEKEIEALR